MLMGKILYNLAQCWDGSKILLQQSEGTCNKVFECPMKKNVGKQG